LQTARDTEDLLQALHSTMAAHPSAAQPSVCTATGNCPENSENLKGAQAVMVGFNFSWAVPLRNTLLPLPERSAFADGKNCLTTPEPHSRVKMYFVFVIGWYVYLYCARLVKVFQVHSDSSFKV